MSVSRFQHVVYCRCARGGEVPADVKDAVLDQLAGSDATFEAVADLCELAARRDPSLARWARDDGTAIVACRPRAVRWLFHAAGAELPDAEARVLDMRALPAGQIASRLPHQPGPPADHSGTPPDGSLKVVLYEGPGAEALDGSRRRELAAELLDAGYRLTRTHPDGTFPADTAAAIVIGHFADGQPPRIAPGPGRAVCRDVSGKCACGTHQAVDEARESLGLPQPGEWVPWFPVLDYDRCVDCGQCASFCLFGVFETGGDGKVRVAAPDRCKTNCPACARMCPKVAVIFPKYPGAPIDGSEVDEAAVGRERAGTDLRERLRGDVYNVLRQRGKGAPLPARPTPAQLAEAAEELQIPAAVLRGLHADAPGEPTPCACRPEALCCQDGTVHDDCCQPDGCCDDDGDCCGGEATASEGGACCGKEAAPTRTSGCCDGPTRGVCE